MKNKVQTYDRAKFTEAEGDGSSFRQAMINALSTYCYISGVGKDSFIVEHEVEELLDLQDYMATNLQYMGTERLEQCFNVEWIGKGPEQDD